jgi:malonate-semialdehyde dehydrogenase (acetylating)/methylmalonate-semialdehyde dehydrogenase
LSRTESLEESVMSQSVATGQIVQHWIAGAEVESASGRTGPVWNPATGQQIAEVNLASAADVDRAVAAAKAAFPAWRAVPLSRRAEVFFNLRSLIETHREELAHAISTENGKTLADARGEIARGLENVEFACGIPALLKGGYSEQASTNIDVYQLRQPLGVVAGICPFNFPAMVPLWMFPSAIACGNTFVLKPSEKVPSASLILARLAQKAGLPPGVFNVVHGDKVAVDRLLEHKDVRAISFVGSTPVARAIYQAGTHAGKRVQALGGAKNHMVVLPDADIDAAADAAVSAGYGAAGQRCMAISVVVAVGAVADPLVEAIRKRIPKIKIGPGLEDGSEMGPLVTRQQRDRVAGFLDSAVQDGATVAVDGRENPAARREGFFLGASLIDHVKPGNRCYDEEIFGPVLSVVRAKTYAEAVTLINENPYGNGTAVFTQNGGAARQFQFDVEVGMVGVNVPVPVPVSYYSFGGWKSSLFGDLHIYGPDSLQFYTRSKVVTSRWPDPGTSKIDLGFPQNR